MPESKAHKLLKKKGRKILKKMGFEESEIKEEYSIATGKRTWLRPDVVGISKEKRIAIECGELQKRRMDELSKHFDKVIHLPYIKTIKTKVSKKRGRIRTNQCGEMVFPLNKKTNIIRFTNDQVEIFNKYPNIRGIDTPIGIYLFREDVSYDYIRESLIFLLKKVEYLGNVREEK